MIEDERGFAVILAMMGVLMLSVLGMALALTSSIETSIAGHFRDGAGAGYAAEALALQTVHQIAELADWTQVLDGRTRSTLLDGEASGLRRLRDGSAIDLGEIVNLANCGKRTACSTAERAVADAARPWGLANPRWQLFAWGRLADLLRVPSPFYVVLLVADDPAETDLDPLIDGADEGNPGSGVLLIRSEAFGSGGVHGVIEMTVVRASMDDVAPGSIRIVSWRAGE